MSPTTWDGRARVEYLPEYQQLHVTLSTVEPTTETELRDGLRVGFVSDDPDGPPAFVAVTLRANRLTADVHQLLGPRLAAAAEQVTAGPVLMRWTRLNLVEVDDLAAVWAPYRAAVLAAIDVGEQSAGVGRRSVQALGEWAGGLWARLGVDDLRMALADLARAEPVFRGDPFADDGGIDRPEPATATGEWELPHALADAVRIAPRLRWEATGGLVDVVARPVAAGAMGEIWVSFDDGAEAWARLEPDAAGLGRATIASAADPSHLPAVRVRTAEGGRA